MKVQKKKKETSEEEREEEGKKQKKGFIASNFDRLDTHATCILKQEEIDINRRL